MNASSSTPSLNTPQSPRPTTSPIKVNQQNTASRKVIDYRREPIRFIKQEKSKERVSINPASGTLVDQKKNRIFEKLFDLLLIDMEKTFIPLIHPEQVNLRHVPFQLLDLMIDMFTDFENEQQAWQKDKFIQKCNEAYNVCNFFGNYLYRK